MPDVTLVVKDLGDASEAKQLERALAKLGFVNEAAVDSEKGLVAVSYEGGEEELEKIGQAVEESGHEFEHSPGSEKTGD
jgi:copper chaperone CopZ